MPPHWHYEYLPPHNDLHDPSTLAGWIARPLCHLQQHGQGDPEPVAKYRKVAYKIICVKNTLIVAFDAEDNQ